MKNVEGLYSFPGATSLGSRWKAARQKAIFDHFLPELQPDAVVAEVGPGRGEFAQACKVRGLQFIGIEPGDIWAEKLRAAGYKIISETVPPVPLDSDSVDLIHSYDFVEHLLDYRDIMTFFNEAYRVLKPGGYISVVAPNYETIKPLYFKYEYQHTYIVTKYRIANMLGDCGFETVTTRCFLISMAPWKNGLDRLGVHVFLPILTNTWVQNIISSLMSEKTLFRINKNLFDHVALLARKPLHAENNDPVSNPLRSSSCDSGILHSNQL